MDFGKKRQVLDKSLLKKEIVKRNEQLTKQSDTLVKQIESHKREIISLDKESKLAKKKREDILKSINKDKEYVSLLEGKINELSESKLEASKLVDDVKYEAVTFEKMTNDAERKLISAEKKLEVLKKKEDQFKGIQAKINSSTSAAKKAIDDMHSEWESERDSKENEFEHLRETLTKNIEELTKDVVNLTEDKCVLEHEVTILAQQSAQEKESFSKESSKMRGDLQDLHTDAMVKLKQEVNKLKVLSIETDRKSKEFEIESNKLFKVKNDYRETREKFDQWKVNALDEVARMKNKGKLQNIDKAGLSDVLNK